MISFMNRGLRRLRSVLPFVPSRREREMIGHAWGSRGPGLPLVIVSDIVPLQSDVVIASRVLEAYRKAVTVRDRTGTSPGHDVWSGIRAHQSRFFHLLETGTPAELAAYLCNMSRQDATHGSAQGDSEYERIRRDARYRRFVGLAIKDKLVLLAEAVGAIPCENPEQGPWGKSLHVDLDPLVARIATVIGLDIAPPDIDGGMLKIETTGGRFHDRDANAIYTAHFLRQILGQYQHSNVCEIGAGVGRVAYWSYRMGVRSYQIFDLPHMNVLQGFYLLKALPQAKVILFGEEQENEGENPRIVVSPNTGIDYTKSGIYDMVLNQDSFPEVNKAAVLQYLSWILQSSRQYFLSINHESKPPSGGTLDAQLSVPELVREAGGFDLKLRVPYWLRRGYVAELYQIR